MENNPRGWARTIARHVAGCPKEYRLKIEKEVVKHGAQLVALKIHMGWKSIRTVLHYKKIWDKEPRV